MKYLTYKEGILSWQLTQYLPICDAYNILVENLEKQKIPRLMLNAHKGQLNTMVTAYISPILLSMGPNRALN